MASHFNILPLFYLAIVENRKKIIVVKIRLKEKMGSNIVIKNLSLLNNFEGRTAKCCSATNNSLHHNIMEQ